MKMPIEPIAFDKAEDKIQWNFPIYRDIAQDRYIINSIGDVFDTIEGKFLKQSINGNGFPTVTMTTTDGNRKTVNVHRMIAENLIPRNVGMDQVNHIDGNNSNNSIYNLEWCMRSENPKPLQYMYQDPYGLTSSQVERACIYLSQGYEFDDILDKIGLEKNDKSRKIINDIYKGNCYTHISSNYTFPTRDSRFRAIPRSEVEAICRCIQNGMRNTEIYDYLYGTEDNKDRDNKCKTISKIRNKKIFDFVSCNYNF